MAPCVRYKSASVSETILSSR